MRGIDCAHSRTLKTLPWSWFREGIGVLKRKSNIFGFLCENHRFLGFSRRRIDCAHSRSLKMLPWPWFREMSVFIYYVFGFPVGLTSLQVRLKTGKFFLLPLFDFRFNTPISSLNQGQRSIFKIRKCAQSIPRIKLPPEIRFWGRNFKIFRFSLQYTHLFPWIRIKEAFPRFGNAHNRFFA